ncbi:MAG TPA: DUF192 domain-containing protein [Candidatus Binatia bacterium]|nr:DUF192 domain-containing protein [Candidatus Binatia bacterium]
MLKPASAKTASALKLQLISLIVLVVVLVLAGHHASSFCVEQYRHDETLRVNGHSLSAQLAATEAQREKGLGGRACIGTSQAMLFLFNQPGYYYFWMRDMHFAVDMVWLSDAKQVVYVQPNVLPSTYPNSFVSQQPARYVIELRAGQAERLGIGTGTKLAF